MVAIPRARLLVPDRRLLVPEAGQIIGGRFLGKIIRDTKVVDEFECKNIVVNQGLNYLLGAALGAQSVVTNWFIGLFSNNYTLLASDTAATIAANAGEVTQYTAGTRQSWQSAPPASQSITNAANSGVVHVQCDIERLWRVPGLVFGDQRHQRHPLLWCAVWLSQVGRRFGHPATDVHLHRSVCVTQEATMAGGKGSTFDNDLLKLIFNGVAIAGIADNAASGPLTCSSCRFTQPILVQAGTRPPVRRPMGATPECRCRVVRQASRCLATQ